MRKLSFLLSLTAANLLQGTLCSLENNLNYRSPSTTIHSLEIPIHKVKRSLDTYTDEYFKGNVTFDYSVASGDPEQDSIILWTKADKVDAEPNSGPPVCVKWQVSTTNFTNVVADGEAYTSEDVDFTVKVNAQNLKPYTQYYYRFFNCAGEGTGVSDVGKFKTLPEANSMPDKIRMAVFSCANYPNGYFNAYANAAKHSDRLDYVQHVGDYIYENIPVGKLFRPAKPFKEITSLSDYRKRYASWRTDVDLLELHKLVAWQMVWDDHEVANNAYNEGSTSIAPGNFTERRGHAVRAYYEWMPIRQVDTDDKLRIWRNFDIGKLGSLTMIDTRQYDRDVTDLFFNKKELEKVVNNTDRSIMGEKQEEWFRNQLSRSQERGTIWKLIGNQVIFSHLNMATRDGDVSYEYDAWDGYQASQHRTLNHIENNDIQNIVWLTGDTHAAWASEIVPIDASKYDPQLGNGSLGIELAGTAVSSSSSYTAITNKGYINRAKQLVGQNSNLKLAEGKLRGYFELELRPEKLSVTYFGFEDMFSRNTDAIEIATLEVKKDTNSFTRPLNGGKKVEYGALGVGAE